MHGDLGLLDQISIVLVNTSHPGNIGATARAMKNMGLEHLVLVSPKEFPHAEATVRASGADDLLARAKLVNNLQEAIADVHFVVGTSARTRTIPWPLANPRQCVQKIAPILEASQRVAFVFGNEQSGLSNEELALCHYHLQIPTSQDFSSLNVAAAVQIVCYECRMMQEEAALTHEPEILAQQALQELRPQTLNNNDLSEASHLDLSSDQPLRSKSDETGSSVQKNSRSNKVSKTGAEPLATMAEMESFYQHLERLMTQVGYLKMSNPGRFMLRLRRLFNRAVLEQNEIHILRGIFTLIEQRLAQNNADDLSEESN